MFGRRSSTTPVSEAGLRKYDDLPAAEAAVKAWTTPGNNPDWNAERMEDVRAAMPLLARALDRLANEATTPGPGRRRATVPPAPASALEIARSYWEIK